MEGNLGEYKFWRNIQYEEKSNQAVATIYQGNYISIFQRLRRDWAEGGTLSSNLPGEWDPHVESQLLQ